MKSKGVSQLRERERETEFKVGHPVERERKRLNSKWATQLREREKETEVKMGHPVEGERV